MTWETRMAKLQKSEAWQLTPDARRFKRSDLLSMLHATIAVMAQLAKQLA